MMKVGCIPSCIAALIIGATLCACSSVERGTNSTEEVGIRFGLVRCTVTTCCDQTLFCCMHNYEYQCCRYTLMERQVVSRAVHC
ncbi:unnamed protein product [Nezara viridula]|uniref:Neuropeptide n=1 Tax=Nezara viridula TaxID=85310 RepID=A0A9P0MSD8_NEZVI|nr:unnamed protein product [Nezara viridula]